MFAMTPKQFEAIKQTFGGKVAEPPPSVKKKKPAKKAAKKKPKAES